MKGGGDILQLGGTAVCLGPWLCVTHVEVPFCAHPCTECLCSTLPRGSCWPRGLFRSRRPEVRCLAMTDPILFQVPPAVSPWWGPSLHCCSRPGGAAAGCQHFLFVLPGAGFGGAGHALAACAGSVCRHPPQTCGCRSMGWGVGLVLSHFSHV